MLLATFSGLWVFDRIVCHEVWNIGFWGDVCMMFLGIDTSLSSAFCLFGFLSLMLFQVIVFYSYYLDFRCV